MHTPVSTISSISSHNERKMPDQSDVLCFQKLQFWRRRSRLHNDQETSPNTVNKKNRDKRRSFDDYLLLSRNFPGARRNFSGYQVSSRRLSLDHSNIAAEKKGYPLPLPLPLSSPDPSSRSTDRSSLSSVSKEDDELVSDCDTFGSFRAFDESKDNSWSRTSDTASKASIAYASSPKYPMLWGSSFQFSPESNENGNHPSHPLPRPPVSPSKPSGCLESKWKKGKVLGRGTFGHVYAGFNSDTGKMCAIKEVRIISDDQRSKECLNRLNQEIEVLSHLSHPNIVQYYGSELGDDKLSVNLEYVSGGSIHKLLQEYGPFGEQVIQSYTKKILSGLMYLHEKNTVHRDIRGANILVNPKGEVKLADFGVAKHIASCSSVLSFEGSPYWMAPEVITNSGGYNLAVDIWSLGCTILEMATTEPPWSEYDGVSAMFRIANDKDVPEIPNHLSDEAKSFIEICLQRNPAARPTAAQLMYHPFIQGKEENKILKGKRNGGNKA